MRVISLFVSLSLAIAIATPAHDWHVLVDRRQQLAAYYMFAQSSM
jgi:hypothetical protein